MIKQLKWHTTIVFPKKYPLKEFVFYEKESIFPNIGYWNGKGKFVDLNGKAIDFRKIEFWAYINRPKY